MNLMILSSEFPPGPGGIGTHAYQLACNLQRLGWQVEVVTSQDYASKEEIKLFNQLQPFPIFRWPSVFRLTVPMILIRLLLLFKRIKEYKPDILLASGDRVLYLVAMLTRFIRLPWVAVEHGRIPAAQWERRLKKWALREAACVVCVSRYTSDQMHLMDVQPRANCVIPNGADSSQFSVLPASKVNLFRERYKEGFLLLTVGHVSERKGQEIVIRALPFILKEFPNTHYLLAGLPTIQTKLEETAGQLGVRDHVHFLGKVKNEELFLLINACEIFIMPSRHAEEQFEGYGIAVVEAALCGKPSIVSRNSGLVEAIVEGETGLSFPEGDKCALAEAVLLLLKDANLREKMGNAAQTLALQSQTWEHRAKEYDALLRRLTAEGSVIRESLLGSVDI